MSKEDSLFIIEEIRGVLEYLRSLKESVGNMYKELVGIDLTNLIVKIMLEQFQSCFGLFFEKYYHTI